MRGNIKYKLNNWNQITRNFEVLKKAIREFNMLNSYLVDRLDEDIVDKIKEVLKNYCKDNNAQLEREVIECVSYYRFEKKNYEQALKKYGNESQSTLHKTHSIKLKIVKSMQKLLIEFADLLDIASGDRLQENYISARLLGSYIPCEQEDVLIEQFDILHNIKKIRFRLFQLLHPESLQFFHIETFISNSKDKSLLDVITTIRQDIQNANQKEDLFQALDFFA